MNNFSISTIQYNPDLILGSLTSPNTEVRSLTILELRVLNKIFLFKSPILSALYFNLPPNFIGWIHQDNSPKNQNPVTFALNVPLDDCSRIYMNWFTKKENTESRTFLGVTGTYNDIPLLDQENSIKTESVNYYCPLVVKVDDWHSVDNIGKLHSRFLSLRFSTKLSKEQILNIQR